MLITWKVIVRETCFCEKILADYRVSRGFQKYFNFVPMLESCNVDHVKENYSWDIICLRILADIADSWVFQKCFNFVPMLVSWNVNQMKSNLSDTTVSPVSQNYFNFVPNVAITEYGSIKKWFFLWLFVKRFWPTSQFLGIFNII